MNLWVSSRLPVHVRSGPYYHVQGFTALLVVACSFGFSFLLYNVMRPHMKMSRCCRRCKEVEGAELCWLRVDLPNLLLSRAELLGFRSLGV